MNRLVAVLIPMLAGFLLTVGVVSWRSDWWQRRTALGSPAATALSVEVRQSNLRVVQVHLTDGAPVAAPRPPEATPQPVPDPYAPPPVPRVDAGNSPERLEVSARKFAHGSRADGD